MLAGVLFLIAAVVLPFAFVAAGFAAARELQRGWDEPVWPIFLAGVMGVVTVVCGIGLSANSFSSAACEQHSKRHGVATSYRFLTGCYVQMPDGDMIPYDTWRNVQQR